jgi:hypothetical protein
MDYYKNKVPKDYKGKICKTFPGVYTKTADIKELMHPHVQCQE